MALVWGKQDFKCRVGKVPEKLAMEAVLISEASTGVAPRMRIVPSLNALAAAILIRYNKS